MLSSTLRQYCVEICNSFSHGLIKLLLAPASSQKLITFEASASLLHLLPYANVPTSSLSAHSPGFPLQCSLTQSHSALLVVVRWESILIHEQDGTHFLPLCTFPGVHLLWQLKGARAHSLAWRLGVRMLLEPAMLSISRNRVASSLHAC